MKPLIVLLSVFFISLILNKIFTRGYKLGFSGRIAIAVMLVFTAIAHIVFTEGMAMMIPSFIPFKTELVYLTGILEIAAAFGILIPGTRLLTAWLLIAFFILILPANIYAALNTVDYQNAHFNGPGLSYLWFRIPLQIFFIGWTYFTAIHLDRTKEFRALNSST